MATSTGTAERVAAKLFVDDPIAHAVTRARLLGAAPPRIGRYAIVRRIGTGGMGVVYLARDEVLGRDLALKTLAAVVDPRVSDRLPREAKALARLSHPHVVQVYDVGLHEGRCWIAMELVEGGNLRQWQQGRSLSEIVAAYCAAGRGIAAAHAVGLLHRDVKPENVLIGRDGRPRVADFGIAAEWLAPSDTSEGEHGATRAESRSSLMGTPAYMSPEQRAGERLDVRADIYSFCVALFEALAGQHPFAEHREIDWTMLPAKTPRHVRAALARGLEPVRGDRFASMDALLAALARPPRRFALVGAVAIAGVLVAVGVQARAEPSIANPCAELDLAPLWDDGSEARLSGAFVRAQPGYGASTWTAVGWRLADAAAAWSSAREHLCDGSVSAEGIAAGVPCLAAEHTRLAKLIELLEAGDPHAVKRVPALLDALPRVSECLALADAPPVRTRTAAAYALDERIAGLSAELVAGQVTEVGAVIDDVVAEAEALDDPATKVHAWLLHAEVLKRSSPERSNERFIQAYFAANEHDLGPQAGHAAIELMTSYALQEDPVRTDEWRRNTEAAIARFGLEGRVVEALARQRNRLLVISERLDEAETMMRARIARLRADDEDSLTLTIAISDFGELMAQRGRAHEAELSYREAYERKARLVGNQHPDVVTELAGCSTALGMQGRRAESEAKLLEAIAIVERTHPVEQRLLALLYVNLATTMESTRPEIALGHAREALRLADSAKLSPMQISQFEHTLGNITRDVGLADESLAHFERERTLIETSQGADHPDLGHPLHSIGNAYRERGDFVAAEALFRRALELWTHAYGPEHPLVSYPLQSLGELELQRERPRDAIPYLRRALALREANPGQPAKLAQTRFDLARALWSDRETRREALDLAAQARDGYATAEDTKATELDEVDAWLRTHTLAR